MTDYSQHGEQGIILDYFGDAGSLFLDIGANDGVTFSNTHALYQIGWGGVCVDASPTAIEALQRTYANEIDVRIVHAAITDRDGSITLHDCSDTLVSSLNAGAEAIWKHHGFDWKPVDVPCMTMETLYAKVGTRNFDFINIDAEGHDLEILRQVDLAPVKMLCVEYGKHIKEVVEHCKGFRVLVNNGVNVILAR